MMTRILALVILLAGAPAAQSINLNLDFDRLQDAFRLIPDSNRSDVDEIVLQLRRGNHTEALARLNQLNKQFPDNSSLRLMTAYALLNIGNLLGAFEEVDRAHAAPNGNSYKCLFFSKVALLAGRHEACRRELKHAKGARESKADVKEIETELKKAKKS